jgi:hypothetical protein
LEILLGDEINGGVMVEACSILSYKILIGKSERKTVKPTEVSEEYVASIVRFEDEVKQKAKRKEAECW